MEILIIILILCPTIHLFSDDVVVVVLQNSSWVVHLRSLTLVSSSSLSIGWWQEETSLRGWASTYLPSPACSTLDRYPSPLVYVRDERWNLDRYRRYVVKISTDKKNTHHAHPIKREAIATTADYSSSVEEDSCFASFLCSWHYHPSSAAEKR
jgi:hypothetical protein